MTSLIPPGRVGAIISSMTSQMRTPEGGTVTPLMPGPHTQGLESLEGKGEGGQGHRDAMKAGLWRQRRRLERRGHKPRNHRSHQKPEKEIQGPPRRRGPTDSLVSDSGLLDWGRLNSCCFRTLRGWEFVTAAYSGVHQDPGKEWGQDGWDTAESQGFWGAGGALDVGTSYHCGCYNGPEHPLTLWGLWSPGISSGWTRAAR